MDFGDQRSRVGLVLGGGGAPGHGFHRGVLAALEDSTGFDPRRATVIVGTSSGATTASLIRAGFTGTDLAARACGDRCPERMAELRARCTAERRRPATMPPLPLGPPASPRGVLATVRRPGARTVGTLASALLPSGRVPTTTAGGPLEVLFGRGWPEGRLWIVAVRLDDGARVTFGAPGAPDVDVATAVSASCALPGWFRPVKVDGQRYVDGAAWSTTNADLLSGEELDLVIVVAPLVGKASMFHRLQQRYLSDEVRRLARAGIPVVCVGPTRRDLGAMGANLMDGRRRDEVTRVVRDTTNRRLRGGDLAWAAELIQTAVSPRHPGAVPPRAGTGFPRPSLVRGWAMPAPRRQSRRAA